MKISIFTTPRPFIGEFKRIQLNAILSWQALKNVEIFLFNDEKNTTKRICKNYGFKFIPSLKKNINGTPFINDCFKIIRKKTNTKITAYVNTDIILQNDFVETIKKIDRLIKKKYYYIIGQRYNIKKKLNLKRHSFDNLDLGKFKKKNNLHGLSGMDYWVFPRKLAIPLPPFIVGRPGIDSWLVKYFKEKKIPIIDATDSITAIHQRHSYPKKNLNYYYEECEYNISISGGSQNLMTLRESDYIYNLSKNLLLKPQGVRYLISIISKYKIYSFILIILRKIKKFFKHV
jgi:hypothetical protein